MMLTLWCLLAVASCTTATSHVINMRRNFATLTSPKFPLFYPDMLDDSWTIYTEPGYRIVLYFTHFNLEDSFDILPCSADFVELFDGPSTTNTSLGRFCGNNQLFKDDAPAIFDEKIVSTGNSLSIRFKSDYSNEDLGYVPTGFRAHYLKQDINECAVLEKAYASALEPESVGKCDQFCNNYPGGYYCSCGVGYILGDDGYTCEGNCRDQVIENPEGVNTLGTPGFPGLYPRSTNCQWKIQTRPGGNIELNFNRKFGIEQHKTGMCIYDWLEIYDNSGKIGRFCGDFPPKNGSSFRSSTNWFKVVFHSDHVAEESGFQITYQAQEIRCAIPKPPMHGRMTRPVLPPGQPLGDVPFSSLLRFECNVGYRLIGSAKLICLKDGSLSDYTPVCEVF